MWKRQNGAKIEKEDLEKERERERVKASNSEGWRCERRMRTSARVQEMMPVENVTQLFEIIKINKYT